MDTTKRFYNVTLVLKDITQKGELPLRTINCEIEAESMSEACAKAEDIFSRKLGVALIASDAHAHFLAYKTNYQYDDEFEDKTSYEKGPLEDDLIYDDEDEDDNG